MFIVLLILVTLATSQANDQVNLPSFLQSLTSLRTKLIKLLGTMKLESNDLVKDSVFEDQRDHQHILDQAKPMPNLIGEPDEDYEEYYEYNYDHGRVLENQEEVCDCATNHKILDTSNKRIVGGSVAIPNALPWQAFVRINKTYRCGGSILNKRFVLSAMHCFHGFVDLEDPQGSIIVGGGIHDLCVDPNVASQFWQLSHVKKVHHPGSYDPESFDNDIAILELKKDFVLNDIIQPVCLPDKQYPPGEDCFVSGWGHNEKKETPCELQYVGMPILSQEVCRASELGQTYKNTLDRELPDVQMCAGHLEGGKDACQGDSGGPLVTTSDEVVKVIGIVSWGVDCALENAPGSYTNVFKYIDFIKETIAPGNCKKSPVLDLDKCNYKSWAGNGYCDDPVNTIECHYDLGDCCPKNTTDTAWKKYCTECICKEK